MKRTKRRILSILMTLCMIVTCMMGMKTTAFAGLTDLSTCSISVDVTAPSVTVSNGGVTINPDCYTLDFYKSSDSSNSLGNTFPTEPDTYFVVASGIEEKGYSNKISSSAFTVSSSPVSSDIDISKGTLSVNVASQSATLTVNGSVVSTGAYSVAYYQRVTNGSPLTVSGFPTTAGTYFAVADPVTGKGYTGRATSADFTIGTGEFVSIIVDAPKATVTVKNGNGSVIDPSNYELVYFEQLSGGGEGPALTAFPTTAGTYVAVAKGKGSYDQSMISSTSFTVSAPSSDISLSSGVLTVDPAQKTVSLTVNGQPVPTAAYKTRFIDATGTNTPSYDSDVFPTVSGTYFAIAEAVSGSGYYSEAYSSNFTVTGSSANSETQTPVVPEPNVTVTTTETSETPANQEQNQNTQTTESKDENGNDVTTTKTTNNDGSVTEKSVVKDAATGKVLFESEKISSTVKDAAGVETTTEKTVEKGADGKETVTDTTIVKDTAGNITEDSTTKKADGTQSQTKSVKKTTGEEESTTVEKDQSGQVVAVSTEQVAQTGEKTSNSFEMTKNDGLKLKETSTTGDTLVIPSEILAPDGSMMPVTSIGEGAFTDIGDAEKIVIPDSVKVIEAGAFDNIPGKVKIKISVSRAGDFAVQDGAASGFKKKTIVVIKARNRLQFNRIVRKLRENGGDRAIYKYKRLKNEEED